MAVFVIVAGPNCVDRFAVAVIVTVFDVVCEATEFTVTSFVRSPGANVTAVGGVTALGSLLEN